MELTRSRVLLVAVALVLAGCGAAETPTPTPDPGASVTVDVTNDHDQAYVITVGAAPHGHRGLAVEREDGSVEEYPDADGVEDLPVGVVPQMVSLRPVGEDTQSEVFRWDGQQSDTVTFEAVPKDAVVYYTVSFPTGDRPLRSFGKFSCGEEGNMAAVTVHVNADGSVSASNECAEGDAAA